MSLQRCGGALLLVLLLVGCGTSRRVRLETVGGPPLEYVPSSWAQQVEVGEEDFETTLAWLLLEVPLSVRPSRAGHRVLAASSGQTLDRGYRYTLRREYGRWCEAREAPGDCLSLLEDGLGFDEMDRLKAAIAFAIDPVWEGAAEELRGTLQPELLSAVVVSGLASYVALLAFPEPVVSKAGAVLLTVWLVAYLGTGPFLELARACATLKQATDRASTFSELEEAGARFGRTLGRNGTRVAVLLVTAALGGGLASRGPTLPGFPLAARWVEAQAGLRLMSAGAVRSIAISSEGTLTVGLAPTALAAMSQGPGHPPATTGGSGPTNFWTDRTSAGGTKYRFNTGHGYHRPHEGPGGIRRDFQGTGLTADQIETAILRQLERFRAAGGVLPVAGAPGFQGPFQGSVTIGTHPVGFRAVQLPTGDIAVSTYFPL